jgi:3-oxoadipate enol-lactonase
MPYVRTRLGRWFYEERGASKRPRDPAILLMHGFMFDGRMWKRQVEPLAEIGRVVVLDGPGHGRSEAPPRFMLEDHADALLDVYAELAIERAVIVGLSWGGMVGMRMAIQHAERVKALALLDTNAEVEPRADRIKYRLLLAFTRRYGMPPSIAEREATPKFFSAQFRREKPEIVESYIRAARGFERDGFCRAGLAVLVKRKDISAKLGSIHVPALVLCGSEDIATPVAKSEAIARGIPGARLVVVDGVGHMSSIEKPDEVNASVVPFVREQVAGT